MTTPALARHAAWLSLALFLPGCASLSDQECRDQDWYRIGFDDGYDGAVPTRITAHREACIEYGIEPDVEQYEAGRRDGLVHYCTAARGYDVGRQGLQYGGGCPTGGAREFLRGHDLGRRFYGIDQRLGQIEQDLRSYRARLASVDLDENQQRRLQSLIRDLEFERSQVEDDRRHLEWELRRL